MVVRRFESADRESGSENGGGGDQQVHAPQTTRSQVNPYAAYSPIDLFVVLLNGHNEDTSKNTNTYAVKAGNGKKFTWADLEVGGSCTPLGSFSTQHWWGCQVSLTTGDRTTSCRVLLPATVMSRDRSRALLSNIHPSDSVEDINNEERKEHHSMTGPVIQPPMDEFKTAHRPITTEEGTGS
ncbi:piggyBac transposable element-derived protein 4-like protein [Lates japonicus]|uniref:PiggyBac transposable element-derived protein 4-like protein n=1 Tax=Lates japonicus TaxID=270547 RepID=A0AAD3RAV0_LATJO|nr:piggyBac transposable element-derived protein 4-like protein [Lates japonicus]